MLRLLKNLFGVETKPAKRKSRRPHQRRVLRVEGLESRELMAVVLGEVSQQLQPLVRDGGLAADTQLLGAVNQQFQAQALVPAAVSVSVVNNDLYIHGTNGPDDITLSRQADGKYVVLEKTVVNGRGVTKSTSWVVTGGDIFFYGYGGNDKFSGATFLRANLDGGEGHDTLSGGYGADNIQGGNGNDTIKGHGGHDTLDGGFGADDIDGGDGNDTIWCGPDFASNGAVGGPGNDTITGGYGADTLIGGAGNDTIDGSYGSDSLFGDDGDDTLIAGNDSDYNYVGGGGGNDKLYGSYGADDLYGNGGDDWLSGGAGDDYLNGGSGHDRLYGLDGDDELFGEGGDDVLIGGTGNDYLNGGTGYDRLYGQDGDDALDGGGDDNVEDRLLGGAGRDTFYAEYDFDDSWWPEWLPPVDYEPPMSEVKDFESGLDNPPLHYGGYGH